MEKGDNCKTPYVPPSKADKKAQKECKKIKCGRDCTSPCGWNKKRNKCKLGEKTTQDEMNLGKCTPIDDEDPLGKQTNVVTKPVRSWKSCEDLNWSFNNSTEVCASSQIEVECWKGTASFTTALTVCNNVGARLCTQDELLASVAQNTGCGLNQVPVWSSTKCGNEQSFAVTGKQFEGVDQSVCTPFFGGDLQSVRCCADIADRETETSDLDMVPKSSKDLDAALTSKPCSELQWSVKTVDTVCGASVIDGECHTNADYATATQVCLSAGARLCTSSELENDVTAGTGCALDNVNVWTSTPCGEGGFQIRLGQSDNRFKPFCGFKKGPKKYSVRCCADVGSQASIAIGDFNDKTSGRNTSLVIITVFGVLVIVIVGLYIWKRVKKARKKQNGHNDILVQELVSVLADRLGHSKLEYMLRQASGSDTTGSNSVDDSVSLSSHDRPTKQTLKIKRIASFSNDDVGGSITDGNSSVTDSPSISRSQLPVMVLQDQPQTHSMA